MPMSQTQQKPKKNETSAVPTVKDTTRESDRPVVKATANSTNS